MTETEQQTALCEWMGWIKAWEPHSSGEDGIGSWYWHKGNQNVKRLPDTNSLDVLHEMEKKLTDAEHETFTQRLVLVIEHLGENHHIHWTEIGSCRRIVSASAPQRREALLKTLGLWRVLSGSAILPT